MKRKIGKINLLINGWEQVAPLAVLGGLTLAQYKEAMAPALASQARLAALLAELEGERKSFEINCENCYRITTQMASSVKGDAKYGDDSPLYSAIGYTRRSDRKSGLTRKAKAAAAAAQNAETSAS